MAQPMPTYTGWLSQPRLYRMAQPMPADPNLTVPAAGSLAVATRPVSVLAAEPVPAVKLEAFAGELDAALL